MHQFAKNSSDPLWEAPGWRKEHVVELNFHQRSGSDESRNPTTEESHTHETSTARKEALREAASHLNFLCASNAPVADVETFLKEWQDPSSEGRLQPNVLAWFNDTNAMQWACTKGDQALLHILLEHGLQPTTRVVPHAVKTWRETKDRSILQLLVDFGLDVNEPIDHDAGPMLSLLLDDLEMVQWCLSLGADPNAPSTNGHAPSIIQMAASYGHSDVLKLLIEHGCDPTKHDLIARACFYRKDKPSGVDVVRFLVDHGAPVDKFWEQSHSECCDGSCLDMVTGKQNGLHFAISSGNLKMVKLLVQQGADKDLPAFSVVMTQGKTVSPIELARMRGHEDIVRVLEDHDTDYSIS